MIQVQIVGLQRELQSGSPVLLLGELQETNRVLPIFIGPNEARAISLAAQGVTPPRPSTYDLMIDVLRKLEAELVRVDITELREGTFWAEIELSAQGRTVRVSARPSDAIALAVRHESPIYVSSAVLNDAGVPVEHERGNSFDEEEVEAIVSEFQEFLAGADAGDFADKPADEEDEGNDEQV